MVTQVTPYIDSLNFIDVFKIDSVHVYPQCCSMGWVTATEVEDQPGATAFLRWKSLSIRSSLAPLVFGSWSSFAPKLVFEAPHIFLHISFPPCCDRTSQTFRWNSPSWNGISILPHSFSSSFVLWFILSLIHSFFDFFSSWRITCHAAPRIRAVQLGMQALHTAHCCAAQWDPAWDFLGGHHCSDSGHFSCRCSSWILDGCHVMKSENLEVCYMSQGAA